MGFYLLLAILLLRIHPTEDEVSGQPAVWCFSRVGVLGLKHLLLHNQVLVYAAVPTTKRRCFGCYVGVEGSIHTPFFHTSQVDDFGVVRWIAVERCLIGRVWSEMQFRRFEHGLVPLLEDTFYG